MSHRGLKTPPPPQGCLSSGELQLRSFALLQAAVQQAELWSQQGWAEYGKHWPAASRGSWGWLTCLPSKGKLHRPLRSLEGMRLPAEPLELHLPARACSEEPSAGDPPHQKTPTTPALALKRLSLQVVQAAGSLQRGVKMQLAASALTCTDGISDRLW